MHCLWMSSTIVCIVSIGVYVYYASRNRVPVTVEPPPIVHRDYLVHQVRVPKGLRFPRINISDFDASNSDRLDEAILLCGLFFLPLLLLIARPFSPLPMPHTQLEGSSLGCQSCTQTGLQTWSSAVRSEWCHGSMARKDEMEEWASPWTHVVECSG